MNPAVFAYIFIRLCDFINYVHLRVFLNTFDYD